MYYESHCRICAKDVHCCIFKNKSGFTFIGLDDAKNISKKTKKEYKDFLDYSPLPKKTVKLLKDEDPSLEGAIRYNQLDKKQRILRLKIKKDGTCIFLEAGKCSVYEDRPNICRIFPFWGIKLTNGRIKIIEHDADPKCGIIKSMAKEHKDIEKCMSKEEIAEIKKVFNEIKRENADYIKGIREFVKKIL